MKYLKRFNESVSFEIDDILLELNDIGFKTSKSENEELGEFFINIEKDGNLPSQQIFKFSEISDSLLRLVDYLGLKTIPTIHTYRPCDVKNTIKLCI